MLRNAIAVSTYQPTQSSKRPRLSAESSGGAGGGGGGSSSNAGAPPATPLVRQSSSGSAAVGGLSPSPNKPRPPLRPTRERHDPHIKSYFYPAAKRARPELHVSSMRHHTLHLYPPHALLTSKGSRRACRSVDEEPPESDCPLRCVHGVAEEDRGSEPGLYCGDLH